MDFLILLALHMDANRNYQRYCQNDNQKIDLFLNDLSWRDEWSKVDSDENFVRFLAQKYSEQMQNLGYQKPEQPHEVRSSDRNLPLYHLAFYSKHDLGNRFWKEIQRYADDQTSLDL